MSEVSDDLSRFSLARFLEADPESGAPAAGALKHAIEVELHGHLVSGPGFSGLRRAVERLNELGHHLEERPADPGWIVYFEEIAGGTRHLWIHAEKTDDGQTYLAVVYHEPLEVQEAKRRAALGGEDLASFDRTNAFYERGLELSGQYEEYLSLPEADRLLLCLYHLDTGVNNGGFHTYITNTEGAHLADAPDFLARIGAKQTESIVRDVLQLFPGGFGAGLTDELWDRLDEVAGALDELDGRFYGVDENVAELATRWLEEQNG